MPSPNTLALSVHTDRGQSDMAILTWLVILINNIYIFFYLLHTSSIPFYSTSNGYNKEDRYSRVPRLSDIRYSACLWGKQQNATLIFIINNARIGYITCIAFIRSGRRTVEKLGSKIFI